MEWSQILNFKLLVNNRDVVRSLDFFFFSLFYFFWCALVNLLYGSQGTNPQQCDRLCYLFVPKCVHMNHGRGDVCFDKKGRPVALLYWNIYFLTIYADFCKSTTCGKCKRDIRL